jgi:hypothetical protein
MSTCFLKTGNLDSALYYGQLMERTSQLIDTKIFRVNAKTQIASIYDQMGEVELADIYFKKAMLDGESIIGANRKAAFYRAYIPFLIKNKRISEAIKQTDIFFAQSTQINNLNSLLKGAGFKRTLFEIQGKTDSAYYYSRMEADLSDRIFNQNNKNAIQSMQLNERLREIEETENQERLKETSKQNLQYIIIAIGILSLLTLFLMLSRSFITNTKTIEFLGIITLIIVFEFLNLLLHPFLERITGHSPILILLALVCIAALLIPLHHKVEKWAIHKLIEKNKKIRLALAKKTIEQLEGEPDKNNR